MCDPCVYNDAVLGNKERGRVIVTEALHPKAAWIYFAGSHKTRSTLSKAKIGVKANWLTPSSVSPYSAGTGKNYSIVKIRRLTREP